MSPVRCESDSHARGEGTYIRCRKNYTVISAYFKAGKLAHDLLNLLLDH